MTNSLESVAILHVEDETSFADLTMEFLDRERHSFSVTAVSTVEEALRRFDEQDFDCIVSDYDMPGQDGIKFLKAIRERDEEIPFILFTGKGSEEVASDALSAGATDYLQKEGGTDQFALLANRVTNAVEQYRADRQRQQVEQRYRSLVETAPIPILVYSIDGIVRYANDAAVSFFNADSPSHLRGTSVFELVDATEESTVRDRLESMAEEGDAVPPIEQTTQALDGEVKHAVIASSSVTVGDERVVQSLIYDITDRRRAEERLSALAESFPDLAFIIDEDGRHVETLSGPTSEELLVAGGEGLDGSSLHEIVPEATADRLLGVVSETIESDEPQTVEYRLEVPAGERWFEARAAPLRTEVDGKRAVTWVARDITERKRHEEELEEQNARLEELAAERHEAEVRYRSLFENNPVVIWEDDPSAAKAYVDDIAAEVDDVRRYLEEHPEELESILARTDVIDVNQRALEYYEAESKEQVKDGLADLMTEESEEASRELWAQIAEGATHFRTEMTTRTFEGGRRDEIFEMRIPAAYRDDYSRMFLTATDITERVEREEELERQNERLDEFTSVVSHDLRNPLSVARGRLQLAQEDDEDENLAAVNDALDRMEALIEDLLVMAREGREVGELEDVEFASLIEGCWQNVATESATIEVDVDSSIQADRTRLKQVIENLLRNAVEHGGSDVTVRVVSLEGKSGFVVEDDGPGIPEEERDTIFESGYSTSDEGTGFGLAIVRDIVDAHGWSIHVTEREDGGARFEVTTDQ